MTQNVLADGFTSAKVDILARYRNFFANFRSSPCMGIRVMANIAGRNVRTITGINLNFVSGMSGLVVWNYTAREIKDQLIENEKVDIPAQDVWRIRYLNTWSCRNFILSFIVQAYNILSPIYSPYNIEDPPSSRIQRTGDMEHDVK